MIGEQLELASLSCVACVTGSVYMWSQLCRLDSLHYGAVYVCVRMCLVDIDEVLGAAGDSRVCQYAWVTHAAKTRRQGCTPDVVMTVFIGMLCLVHVADRACLLSCQGK